MSRCQHKRVQQYTDCCLDCGRNIWESDDEYEAYLDKELQSSRIEEKERKLKRLKKKSIKK